MTKSKKIKILIGIPASGKSTWTKEFLRNNSDWVSTNKDYLRLMLRNEQFCEPKIEDLIVNIQIQIIRASLNKNLNVIVDNTNVKVTHIQRFIDEFKYDADIDYQVFDISLKKAIERNEARVMPVDKNVMKQMFEDYKILMDSFHFQPQKRINQRPFIIPSYDSELPQAVIFDIDGTIALKGNRGIFDLDKVDADIPNKIVIEHIKFHMDMGRKIIILSGREDICRNLTEEWLKFYSVPYDKLYMRKADDHRKDSIVKKEIYDEYINGYYNVLVVYDDRLQVLDMWYKEGIFTFNVNQGNIEF